MNKHQKLVQQAFLNKEEDVISRLQSIYGESLSGITKKVKVLDSSITQLQKALDSVTDDDIGELALAVLGSKKHLTPVEAQETIKSMIQSKVYQKQYQEALRKQVGGILDTMQAKQYKTVSNYLTGCYEDGFIGTMYDLQGQGIPLCMPIDQQSMVRAVQLDSKISKGLYTRLGEDVATLKRKITSQISRGVASGLTYREMAQQLAGQTRIGYNNAVRIARTEGHRIQCQAGMDACEKAKEKGCDVLKQWDATLDDVTRSSHAMVDGELREIDKPFSNGLMFPGDPNGGAAEVINCRCALLQRATWELDEEELEELKERAEFFGLDKTASFEEYKKKYLKAAESQVEETPSVFTPAKSVQEAEEYAKQRGVKYVDYSKLPLETANALNGALSTLPDDINRPVFVGDSATLEKMWGGKLPRSSKHYYGVTIDTYDGIHLGLDEALGKYVIDYDTLGDMVGISSSYKKLDKITDAKKVAQARYYDKHGKKWFFNEYGEATPYHEMGHIYANAKGLPKGFEQDAIRWARESGCDMLQKTSEAWAEAWAGYYTKNPDLPDYIARYIEEISPKRAKTVKKGLIFFDDDGIINTKRNDFKRDFEAGKVSTIISKQKQARHIKGSKQFIEHEMRMARIGDKPAYIREDFDETSLQRLVVSKLQGTVRIGTDGSYREFVTCDEIVGYYYSKADGKYMPTRCAQINYALGDGNIHIIPVKEI